MMIVLGAYTTGLAAAADTTPPSVTSIAPSGWITTTSATLSAYFSDASGIRSASAFMYLDGTVRTGCTRTSSTISCPSGTLAAGTHSTRVSVSDVYGNVGTGTGSFSVDATAPAISNVQPTGTITVSSTTVSANFSDAGSGISTASARVSVDGTARTGCTVTSSAVSCPVSGLANGTHNISVSVKDVAGNTATGAGSFSVNVPAADTTPPAVSGIAPSGWVTTTSATISASYSDAGSGINSASARVYLDGVVRSGCSATASGVSCTASGLAAGSHSINVYVRDNSGNTGSSSGSFSVDAVAPAVTGVRPSGTITTSSATVGAYYSDAGSGINSASAQVTVDGAVRTGCTATASGVSCAASGLANGTHTISVSVKDTAGNTGTGSGSFTVNIPVADTTPPSVTGVAPGGWITTTRATVSASYSDAGSGINQVTASAKVDGAVLSGCTVSAAAISCPSGTLAAGAHTIAVSVADNAGNTGSGTGSFTVDATAPAISNIQPTGTLSSGSATISAYYADTGSGISATSAQVSLDGTARTGCTATASTISCPVSGLTNGAHAISVSVKDVAGNTATGTGSFTVSTTASTPPAIASVTPSGTISTDSATIKVSYSESGSGINSGASSVTLDGTPLSGCTYSATAVSCAVTKLVQGAHTIGGRISDNAGNFSVISGGFTSNKSGKPNLKVSYVSATRSGGQVIATFRVTNAGSGTAYSVKMTGNSTSGATLATALPIGLGNIGAGASKTFTAKYNGPTAGQAFSTAWSGSAQTVFLLLFRTTYYYGYPQITITAP